MGDENTWTAKEETIDWFASTSPAARMIFLKSLIFILPEDELKTVSNYISKAKVEAKRKKYEGSKKLIRPKLKVVSAAQSVPTGSEPKGSVPTRKVLTGPQSVGSVPLGSVPHGSVPLPLIQTDLILPTQEDTGWWKKFKPSQVLAFDCEHIHLKELEGEKRIKCAEISIVNNKLQEIYYSKIQWPAGSFITSKRQKLINGYDSHSLINGEPWEIVRNKVKEIFKGNLIITCGGTTDYGGLGLDQYDCSEFDRFDLHQHFKKPAVNQFGISDDLNLQPIGLRSLYHYYFHQDIQSGIHNCQQDAKATMQLFMEVYVKKEKITNLSSKVNTNGLTYANIPTIR